MIQLPHTKLPLKATKKLKEWQDTIDLVDDFAARVELAKSSFKAKNRTSNPTFRKVRASLTAMCAGNRRCCYCEDSVADEVEHIRPKSLFPEQTFLWENYLYACGPCNGPKNAQFAVLDPQTSKIHDISRKKDDPIVPPIPGDHVLIDPRKEDPLEFMMLDILDTFEFVEIANENSSEWIRANYTITILGLNSREYLVEGRKAAFEMYRAFLKEYISDLNNGEPREALDRNIHNIRSAIHPTVWKEMQRSHAAHPALKAIFAEIPEALTW